MDLVVNEYNHCDLVKISGRIDSYSTPQIDAVLEALISADHYNIIIDLENVNFISSSGMLAFVNIQRKLKHQNKGEIVLIHVPNPLLNNFSIVGFDTAFSFFNDLDSATGWFSEPLK